MLPKKKRKMGKGEKEIGAFGPEWPNFFLGLLELYLLGGCVRLSFPRFRALAELLELVRDQYGKGTDPLDLCPDVLDSFSLRLFRGLVAACFRSSP